MAVVRAPDGSDHTVDIEWIGNRLRRVPRDFSKRVRAMRRGSGQVADGAGAGDGDFDVEDLVAAIAIVFLLVVFVIFIVPLAWGLLEALVIVVLAMLVWAARVLFRRPWTVAHRGPGNDVVDQWVVVGWRQAKRVVAEATASIAATGKASVEEAPEVLDWDRSN